MVIYLAEGSNDTIKHFFQELVCKNIRANQRAIKMFPEQKPIHPSRLLQKAERDIETSAKKASKNTQR